MSPYGKLDANIVLGYLKGGTSLDADVVRTRYATFVSGARMLRNGLMIPLAGGILAIVIGLPLSLVIIGIPILLMGLLFGGGAWWARKRIAENLVTVEAVYTEYAATLTAPGGR